MKGNQRKIRNIIKTVVFCIALSICILSAAFSTQWKYEKQNMDLKTAAAVSVGFGAVIELFTLDKRYF